MMRLARRRLSTTPTLLPKLAHDPRKWPSLLASHSGAAVDLVKLEADLQAKGVKYVLPAFVDMHGIQKAKMVPLDHLTHVSRGSELFTGAAVDGVPQAVSDDEVCAVGDPATLLHQLPYNRQIAYTPASLFYHGSPFEPCSRNIYSRVAAQAKAAGFVMNLGIEAEFFVLRDGSSPEVAAAQQPVSGLESLDKPCYDATRLLDNMPWLSELVESMQELGWGVYSFDHEDATGQFEVDFDFCEAGLMADRFNLLRMMACAIARKHGHYASWMPKPMGGRSGNGAHLNVSLHDFESGKNLFRRDDGDHSSSSSSSGASSSGASGSEDALRLLSPLGMHFLGGVMAHLPAIVAVSCPTVNSYKRMVWTGGADPSDTSGFSWAPVVASYGANNRTNAIRLPAAGRFEIRASDSAVNPHLASALVLAAGLEGIERKLDPGPSRGFENLYAEAASLRSGVAGAGGLELLPRTLGEAVEAFAADPLAKSVFGEVMHEQWVSFKRGEWEAYLRHVSDWEVKRYLRQFG